MAFNNLSEIWSFYDDYGRKRFSAHDITAAINQLPEGNSEETLCRFEALAFAFVGTNRENEWGTYYGHQFTFVRQDTGEEVYSPDISQITPEIISYWEERAAKVVNPLLKMRYTGLVLDFKKRITGKQPDYKTIKLANVEAIIEVVDGDYADHKFVALEFADRALKLATGFKNEELVKRVVKMYYDAHNRFGKENLWQHIFHALINYPNAFAQYREEIVNENLDRLNTIEQQALQEGGKTDKYAHEMISQVEILCEYYHSICEDEKIEGLLDRLLTVIRLPIPVRGGMWGHGMLEQMQDRYRKYGLDSKANRLFGELTELGKKSLEEMHRTEQSYSLKRSEIETFLKDVMRGNHDDRIKRFIIDYMPARDLEIKKKQGFAKEAPLEDMISTVLFDGSGNTTKRLGTGKNPEEQKLHFFMYKSMMIESVFMHMHMDELKKNKDVTLDSLMKMFDNCPLVTNRNRALLERGFEAYLNDDHVVCCHILIPQVEAMVRTLVYLNGGEIIHQGEDPAAGSEYNSLESLLDSDVAKKFMKDDMITYFKVLFVSPAGWNLRNLFCHGLLSAGSFNSDMSDRLVHVMMILSLFKQIDRQ